MYDKYDFIKRNKIMSEQEFGFIKKYRTKDTLKLPKEQNLKQFRQK